MSESPIPFKPEELLAQHLERWNQCEGQPEMTLLRLGILREIMRTLHSQKSSYLAKGKREDVQVIKSWEEKVSRLRGHAPLSGDLTKMVSSIGEITKKTRLLPNALFSVIPKEKLERYDRTWEVSLAAEACYLGWRFWSLEAWIEIAAAESWDRILADHLWPHGLVLYAESAQSQATSESTDWKGRWIVILHPHFKTPGELNLEASRWKGASPKPPTPSSWKLLFSPKPR